MASLILVAVGAGPGGPRASAADLGYPVELRTPDGKPITAQVLSGKDDALQVELGGTVYNVAVEADAGSASVEISDRAGKTLLRSTQDRSHVTVTDTRGNSVRGVAGTIPPQAAGRLFDRLLLTLLDSENLAALRGRDISLQPGLVYGVPPQPDLCCDENSVSNCFPPGEDGGCGTGKELVACPAGNCEINGTWNCC